MARRVSSPKAAAIAYLVLALVAAAAAWWLATRPSPRRAAREPPAAQTVKPRGSEVRGWAPRRLPTQQQTTPACAPKADLECIRGDLWWLDGCGSPHELAEECGLALCRDGACEGHDPRCDALDPMGRCDGDQARRCIAGAWHEVDCAERGQHCVLSEEGPVCRDAPQAACSAATPPRCEGDTLIACVEGEVWTTDCQNVGARCMPKRGGSQVGCVRWGPAATPSRDCGACGCAPDPQAEEVCDGRDNDGDGFVDENVQCPVVDLVAVVIADSSGNTPYTQDELDAELVRINLAFARDDGLGLEFRWADVVYLDAPDWLELEGEQLDVVLGGRRRLFEREAFAIPLIFTQSVTIEAVPRPGLATPPNGICGGQRRVSSPQPLLGGVVIAKRRWPTTVAHELGHFLGLCHTHSPSVAAVQVVEGGAEDSGQVCDEPCALEGDGVCDTPPDPGPSTCVLDEACAVSCEDGAEPLPMNIMGYYAPCRSLFTEQQARMMRGALALRLGWHACATAGGCSCSPAARDCPAGMTCAPFGSSDAPRWQCRLSGSRPAGSPCEATSDCRDSICVGAPKEQRRCARTCDPAQPECECRRPEGAIAGLCYEDIPGSAP